MTCKYRFLLAFPLTLALLPAVPAQAQGQPSDVKCLLLSNIYAKQADDEKARAAALQATFFYLGRVTGPVADVQARLKEEAKTLPSGNNGDAMAACANAMVKRADELSAATQPKPAQTEGR
jgi:hypothetical protein